MKGYRRHKFLFGFLRGLLGWVFDLMFHLKLERFGGDGPYIVLANHNADFDPVFIGRASYDHIYFVASEHIFRKGWLSALLHWALKPIPRMKGGTDASAAMGILRAVRGGANVCLFAEGNRSFNGVTCPIYPGTGKLVKSTKARLITYRFEGGYFSTPRWGGGRRRGVLAGFVAGNYAPEVVAAMSAEELDEIIRRDLWEDAYASQEARPVAYRGKNLAEYIETAFYICPCCGKLGGVHSKGDAFWCECGMQGRYTEYCALESDTLPFKTLTEWDAWQTEQLPDVLAKLAEEPFSDDGVEMRELLENHQSRLCASGTLRMDDKTLSCGDISLPLEEITDMGIVSRATIMLTAGGRHYEIKPLVVRCMRKYHSIFALRNGGTII